jgi:dipeptidyl aminopeptidase/acylaminoacyl peptidase
MVIQVNRLILSAMLAASFASSTAWASALAPAEDSCASILPPRQTAGARRRLLPEDLVRLRDIGPADVDPSDPPLVMLSPDGSRAAFQLRRADPDRNMVCLAMVVMDLAPGATPRVVDQGGEFLLVAIDNAGTADFPTGVPAIITPRWSPDGRWIAFLKRVGGTTQVWSAQTDGSGSTQLTHAPTDVVDFRIAPGGAAIVYSTRPGLEEARRKIAIEGLSGFHYDDRWAPVDGNRPFPAPPIARVVQALDMSSGAVRPASPFEQGLLSSEEAGQEAASRSASSGAHAWISATSLTEGAEPGSLHARTGNGPVATCDSISCEGAIKPWLMPDERRVRFFRREGWARSSTAIYEWTPLTRTVRRLYSTDDVLASCMPSGESLICLRDASLAPRRLERLDPATGARQLLFDPNPDFRNLTLGQVRRLRWSNSFGLQAIGDLVLPVGYRPGKRYPLVVVQYQTRGFLRGGTGDEYPIQAFANRGYAVLSVQRPLPVALLLGARSFHAGDKLNLKGFADHISTFSSMETGVRLVIAQGIADPKRLGITGLSNGATNVVWALLHSRLFAAAAMSSCCFDTTLAMRVGPVSAREYREDGYPGMLERNAPFWRSFSLSVNARRVRTPILLQLADYEYSNALETYTSLREAGAPIDMFVFPGEHHNKSQPAHRLAVYRRALDWFDYWLRDTRSQAPDRQAELAHWDSLRASAARR